MNQQSSSHVEEWLAVHRALIAMEAAFTDLALRAAAGEVSTGELAAERARLVRARQECTAAYERAFPKALEQRSTN